MKLGRRIVVGVAVVALLGVGLTVVNAAAALRAQPTATAVVNLEGVFSQLKEKLAFDADLNSQRERIQAEAAEKKRAAELIKADLDTLASGTATHRQKQEEYELAAINYQTWMQFQQAKINREAGLRIEGLYRKVLDATARISEEQGYDTVMLMEPEPTFQYENIQQLLAQIGLRKLLYANPSTDITAQVVQRLNNEYENLR